MIESINIHNLRSFKTTETIKLHPITLLLGENSSGKSTFARLFPLLKQTSEILTNEPILWFGRLVDFGDKKTVKSKFSDSGENLKIEIKAKVQEVAHSNEFIPFRRRKENISLDSLVSVTYTTDGFIFELKNSSYPIEIYIQKNSIRRILINNLDFSDYCASFVFDGWSSLTPKIKLNQSSIKYAPQHSIDLYKFIEDHCHTNTGAENRFYLRRAVSSIQLGEKTLTRLASIAEGGKTWAKYIESLTRNSEDYLKLYGLIVLNRLTSIISSVENSLSQSFNNISYITPLRASAERYYRSQGLSLKEIDSQGRNVAMFIHNLNTEQKTSLDEWVTECFGVTVTTNAIEGHISLEISDPLDNKKHKFNLADTGFGFSQLLPIIVQLWLSVQTAQINKQKSTIVSIEQPELHLHPKLQARISTLLAKSISYANRNNIELKIVIETHSEQIVNKFGELIYKDSNYLKPNDVAIYLFEKKNLVTSTTVTQSKFNEKGYLTNWPFGFFEA